jgi:nucleoside-triphosphatase
MGPKNILITGLPGSGKTTLVEKIVSQLDVPTTGFITREIRHQGNRIGFSIDTLDGRKGVLAHVDLKSGFRVGRYGVRIETIDQIAVRALKVPTTDVLIVIDEIGKMECLSAVFRKAVFNVLDSANPFLATIAMKGDSFMQSVKSREDVSVIEMTQTNRDMLGSSLLASIHRIAVSRFRRNWNFPS